MDRSVQRHGADLTSVWAIEPRSLPETYTELAVPFINTGTVEVQSGALSFYSGLVQTLGETHLAGGSLNGGTFNITGGVLSGSGTINASVVNGATVSPGSSPGTLTINGSYTQTAAGVLQVELGGLTAGSDFDRLVVNGQATLAGALQVSLLPGFVPTPGNSFEVLTCQSRSGFFGSSNVGALGLIETYTTTNLVLTASDRRPRLGSLTRLPNGHWQFRITGLPNVSYVFQASTNLTTWTTLTNLASPTGLIEFTDAEASSHLVRFYRVVEQ